MWNPIRAISLFVIVLLVASCDPNPVKVETYTGNKVVYSVYTEELQFIGQMEIKEFGDSGFELMVTLDEEAPADIRLSFTNGDFLDPKEEILVIGTMSAGAIVTSFEIEPKNMKFQEMGSLNAHVRMTIDGNFFAATDVGQQAFNGQILFHPMENFNPAISGGVEIFNRYNGNALIKINIGATVQGGNHPAHIHMNSYEEGGEILIDLSNVTGKYGISVTEIKKDRAGNQIKYGDLKEVNGHIRVHASAENMQEIIAYGNIGIN